MKKIIPILTLSLALLTACELDYYPTNAMTSAQLADNPTSAVYSTDGNYSMFKDNLEYKGTTYSGNSYVRHYFQMSEFHGDCVALSHKTEDPLYNSMCYSDLITAQPNSYFWWCAYHIIYSANSIIESLPEGTSGEFDHILGENYFMRAICHLHLVTLFAKPYSQGRENMGVILRTSTDDKGAVTRASVGAVYDQIRDDLIKAAQLMAADESRVVNHGYISRDAALGLLSRVYLHREENDKVIETVDGMLGGASALSKLDPDCETYFARALTSDETLWAVAHTQGTSDPVGRETIGSMYYTPDKKGVGGWAEMYYADPLVKLFKRFPADKRYTGFCIPLEPVAGAEQARWAVESAGDTFRMNEIRDVEKDASGNYTIIDGDNRIAVTKKPNGLDTEYFIQWNGEKTEVFIDQKMLNFNTMPALMCAKFTGQDGVALLASPVMIRWAEVILNRAEAYAKQGDEAAALADVNAIRQRAGLSGNALWTVSNYKDGGYDDVLDVVLDERRLELCYEGHRALDLYRNGRSMDRQFAGVQPWEVIEPTDNRIQYRIPYDEISVSGIPQNN